MAGFYHEGYEEPLLMLIRRLPVEAGSSSRYCTQYCTALYCTVLYLDVLCVM